MDLARRCKLGWKGTKVILNIAAATAALRNDSFKELLESKYIKLRLML